MLIYLVTSKIYITGLKYGKKLFRLFLVAFQVIFSICGGGGVMDLEKHDNIQCNKKNQKLLC